MPEDIRARFRAYGRAGGGARARKLTATERTSIARRAAVARWTRERFGASRFADLALPGGELVDEGLRDLANDRTSIASLLVSLAAPRLRREGVPVTYTLADSEVRLYRLLEGTEGEMAHARYTAHLRQVASFADSCRMIRLSRAAAVA